MDLLDRLPEPWRAAMTPYLDAETVTSLDEFVTNAYAAGDVFPPIDDLFAAFRHCALDGTRVLILGQDPYFKAGQAHGLSFSVRPGSPSRRRCGTSTRSCATTSPSNRRSTAT